MLACGNVLAVRACHSSREGASSNLISSALRHMPLACVVCSSERGRGDSLSHSTLEVLRLAAAELCGAGNEAEGADVLAEAMALLGIE